MDSTPDNWGEVFRYLLDEVLVNIELHPNERQNLLKYMNERHEDLYGPFATYFVLGSYEPPYKWRLEIVESALNNRLEAYAYLLASQPDPEIGSDDLLSVSGARFPELKVKYYLHALYADYIVLVMEHNQGGDLTELGRANIKTFFERTYLLPRGWDIDGPDSIEDIDDVRRLAYLATYESEDEDTLQEAVEEIVERAADTGLSVTTSDLMSAVEREFGNRLPPTYSGVLTDEFIHFDRAGRCYPWLTETELRENLDEIP